MGGRDFDKSGDWWRAPVVACNAHKHTQAAPKHCQLKHAHTAGTVPLSVLIHNWPHLAVLRSIAASSLKLGLLRWPAQLDLVEVPLGCWGRCRLKQARVAAAVVVLCEGDDRKAQLTSILLQLLRTHGHQASHGALAGLELLRHAASDVKQEQQAGRGGRHISTCIINVVVF